MLLLKSLRALFSLLSYPRSIKRRFIRPVLLYPAGFCVALNTAQAAVVLPVIDRPTPWKIDMCLNSWYSPNAGYWATWCGIVQKGTWVSRGDGYPFCTNTSPITEQNMVARLRDFGTAMYGDRNCETQPVQPGRAGWRPEAVLTRTLAGPLHTRSKMALKWQMAGGYT